VVVCAGVVGELNGCVAQEVAQQGEAFGPKPEGEGKEEGEARRIAEEVELVWLGEARRRKSIFLGRGCVVEDLLGDNVLDYEEDSARKGREQPDEVCVEVRGTG
jgi:hypothetical protein